MKSSTDWDRLFLKDIILLKNKWRSVWIDKNSLYLTRAIISGKLNEYDYVEDKDSIQRIISLSRFNENIVIENPLR